MKSIKCPDCGAVLTPLESNQGYECPNCEIPNELSKEIDSIHMCIVCKTELVKSTEGDGYGCPGCGAYEMSMKETMNMFELFYKSEGL